MLALSLSAGFLKSASANDIPASDAAAPCGELHLVGKKSYIHNESNFSFNVQFRTEATTYGLFKRSLNAGAVKYLETDANGNGVWRDTGTGHYRSAKTYTVPVRSKSVVTIAYCASRVPNISYILGDVSFTADSDEPQHPIPDGYVSFSGWSDWKDVRNWSPNQEVWFDSPVVTPYVSYNRAPDTSRQNGSLTICPNDPACRLP